MKVVVMERLTDDYLLDETFTPHHKEDLVLWIRPDGLVQVLDGDLR